MGLTYDEARKIAEEKYSATGSTSGIDEGYIKAIQNNDLQNYNQKIAAASPKPKKKSSGGNYQNNFQSNYTPMTTQDAYKKAANLIDPQIQQLKNNLILSLSKRRTNDVTDLATRGQAVGGQRQLADANINSEEALQASNIVLQGDIAKNQLAEQYMATANAEAQRQQALEYQQYMDRMNLDRQNRLDTLNEREFSERIRQNEIDQQNYLAELQYTKEQDAIQNALDQGRLSISQAELALSQARFNYEKSRASSGGSSSGSSGMTDQAIRLEAIRRATDSDGVFDQNMYNQIYKLLSGNTINAPTLTTPIRSALTNSIFSLGRGLTPATTTTNNVAPLNW